MAQTMTIEQAQAYLRENTYGKLRAIVKDPFYGERNATVCNGNSCVIVLKPRSKRHGYRLDWGWVVKIGLERNREAENQTPKFIKEASKADFTNCFIEKCLAANPEIGPYKNGLTTGVPIEGKCIGTKAVEKDFPYLMQTFWERFNAKEEWHSYRERWRGYDMSLWTSKDGRAGLNMEYLDCGNGYYYELINREKFIGVDID